MKFKSMNIIMDTYIFYSIQEKDKYQNSRSRCLDVRYVGVYTSLFA